jgi:hypothetical protein
MFDCDSRTGVHDDPSSGRGNDREKC